MINHANLRGFVNKMSFRSQPFSTVDPSLRPTFEFRIVFAAQYLSLVSVDEGSESLIDLV